MAIVRFNNRKNSVSGGGRNKLKRVLDYITDLSKTCDDLIGGIGVNKDNALDRMNTVKEFYNKSGGREYIHFCVSFEGQQNADYVYDIANQIAMLYDEYQILFAVHLNTANTHIHFVINTVNVADGHKFSQSRAQLRALKQSIDEIIKRFGLFSDDVSIVEEAYDWDYEYEEEDEEDEESELIEPMIFYEEIGLIDPMIWE